ncbi:response regulator transcription factor [Bacillus sp. EB01]|uniref:response regulator transcription factor n=1 Tax=Bacillus sp. EB01 TaxID=1347086 RepID=UPI0005C4A343|nr:response regulator [Bacillus sp. EB01]
MKKVLLVDDERYVRKTLAWTITKLNLPLKIVHECTNGLEALDWLKEHDADLIMTDIRMPVMDGLTLIKALRGQNADVDIIVISVHDEFQFVQQALRSGVVDYLQKPIEETELRECLKGWLDRQLQQTVEKEPLIKLDPELPSSTIEQVMDYIKRTPLGEISLKDAARNVHMNPSYLSQLFKQQTHKKFVDYITELKIEEGKRLLKQTSLRMSEIAERLGYQDLAYFSNTFKKITGRAPSDFRKSNET